MHAVCYTLRIATAFALTACGGGKEAEQPDVGFCGESTTLESLIMVSSATDSISMTPITDVVISEVVIDGVQSSVDAMQTLSTGVQIAGSTLLCRIPCSFGLSEGDYAMSVTATGYKVSRLSFTAKYANVVGGCVKTYSGSKRVTVALEPN